MTACAAASRELAEPLSGTAATARTWLLIEQPGPWGAKALAASHLDPSVGQTLERAADGTGVRVALIRRPGRHADDHRASRRQIFAAHTLPGRSWIRTAHLTDPARLTALDFTALGAGEPESVEAEFGAVPYDADPLALVCTNGKRDRCCALLGRPLAAELAAAGTGNVWEITHLGGHRFAPTLLVLPYGYAYGRAAAQDVKDVLQAVRGGRIVTGGCRGRSAWERPGQVAELAVRELTGEDRAEALAVEEAEAGEPGHWTLRVQCADGRSWMVAVEQREQAPARPESCGKALGTPLRMVVRTVTEDLDRRNLT